METIVITEAKRYGYTIFQNEVGKWEIKELEKAFKTFQQAETYLEKQYKK